MKKIIIYTDGACSGNPGDGGWGAVLKYGEHEKEISGFERKTTNNKISIYSKYHFKRNKLFLTWHILSHYFISTLDLKFHL